jgi:hypothetical protein
VRIWPKDAKYFIRVYSQRLRRKFLENKLNYQPVKLFIRFIRLICMNFILTFMGSDPFYFFYIFFLLRFRPTTRPEVEPCARGVNMARGKRTASNVLRAIVALYDAGMTGAEIADVFGTQIGRRTIYDHIRVIKKERRRQEILEQEREQVALNLKPEWQKGESAPRYQNVRYRS